MAVVALGRLASVFNRVNIRTLEREQKKTNVFNEAARMKTLSTQA